MLRVNKAYNVLSRSMIGLVRNDIPQAAMRGARGTVSNELVALIRGSGYPEGGTESPRLCGEPLLHYR